MFIESSEPDPGAIGVCLLLSQRLAAKGAPHDGAFGAGPGAGGEERGEAAEPLRQAKGIAAGTSQSPHRGAVRDNV